MNCLQSDVIAFKSAKSQELQVGHPVYFSVSVLRTLKPTPVTQKVSCFRDI